MSETSTPAVWRRSPPLPAGPESVPAAREFVLECCRRWGVVAESDAAVQIVSELATNAVRNARRPVAVWVARRLDRIVLSVLDGSPDDSYAVAADEGGRGTDIIDLLADRWGERDVAEGKIVWAEIKTS